MDGLSGIRCEWTGMGAKCKSLNGVHICIERKTHEVSMSIGQGHDEQFLYQARRHRVESKALLPGNEGCILLSNMLWSRQYPDNR